MKFKFFSVLLVIAIVMGAFVSPVKAVAYPTNFLTSITYMNVGTGDASITVDFYEQSATAITKSYNVATLAAGAAASLSVGSVFTTGFTGSAVMSSNQPLVATMVQVGPATGTVKNRPMSNGFSSGSTSALIPTVLKGVFSTNSVFSVQNAGSAAADVNVQFVPGSAGTAVTDTVNLAPGAAKYFDMGAYTKAGATFNGAVRVTSAQPVVASSIEESTVTDAAYAFEGVAAGATKLYMPSALCKYGTSNTTSAYAVQNSSTTTATGVSVQFLGTAGTTAVNQTIDMGTVQPGAKVSVPGCGPANQIPASFIGSAIVTAQQPVVAIAKVTGNGSFLAAHSGVATGAAKLAAPYVRFSSKFYSYTNQVPVQQAYIAVQNIGTADIAIGGVTVSFVDATGAVKGTASNKAVLAPGAKFSVSAKDAGQPEFGYTTGSNGLPTGFGGGALIQGPTGSQLAAIVRVQTNTAAGDVAEDYNAAVVP